ncbi:MAG: hypothetical protein ABIQ66_08985 [Novosphingobium sp.]
MKPILRALALLKLNRINSVSSAVSRLSQAGTGRATRALTHEASPDPNPADGSPSAC